jgi:Zn-dependent protease
VPKISSVALLKIAGIPVQVNYSWILVFILVSANLAYRWYPEVLPDQPKSVYYALGVFSCIALFLCVLAHELSHSFVARKEGAEVRGIILHVFGGVSLINETQYTPAMEFRVSFAGPLLSVFLGAAFWLLRKFTTVHSVPYELFSYLYFINISLAVFNLLPAFPLDGGRLLRSALAYWKKDLLAATRIASRVGIWFAFLLMGYGVIGLLSGNFWGIWTVLIGIFLKDAAEMSFRQMLMQDTFRQQTVFEVMQKNPVIVPPQITVQQLIDD